MIASIVLAPLPITYSPFCYSSRSHALLSHRHPSNLMLERTTGKVIHIDFGDCFEVAMQREKYPERIPFRLTRMLISAMVRTYTDTQKYTGKHADTHTHTDGDFRIYTHETNL